jgi:hypothetical protein
MKFISNNLVERTIFPVVHYLLSCANLFPVDSLPERRITLIDSVVFSRFRNPLAIRKRGFLQRFSLDRPGNFVDVIDGSGGVIDVALFNSKNLVSPELADNVSTGIVLRYFSTRTKSQLARLDKMKIICQKHLFFRSGVLFPTNECFGAVI